MTSNMSIPLFPGLPLGAMHLGPDGVRPTMAGPAPAANGPANAAGNRGSAGPGAAPGAGAGADANRAGQAIGVNIGTLLQSAFAGAGAGGAGVGGGQPNRPGQSLILIEFPFSGRPTARAHIAAVDFEYLQSLSCFLFAMSWSYFADLPCAYLAQHEPESAKTLVVIFTCCWWQSLPCQYLSSNCLSAKSEAGRKVLV